MKKLTALILSFAIAIVGLMGLVACDGNENDEQGENGSETQQPAQSGNETEQPTPEVHVKLTEQEFRAAVDATMNATNVTTVHTMGGTYANWVDGNTVHTFTISYDWDNLKMRHYGWDGPDGVREIYCFVENGKMCLWSYFDSKWEGGDYEEEVTPEFIDIVFAENDMFRFYFNQCNFGAHYNEFVYDEESDTYTGVFGSILEESEEEIGELTLKFKDGKLSMIMRGEFDENGEPINGSDKYTFCDFGTTVVTIPDIPRT